MMPYYDGCELHSMGDSCLMGQDRERERDTCLGKWMHMFAIFLFQKVLTKTIILSR